MNSIGFNNFLSLNLYLALKKKKSQSLDSQVNGPASLGNCIEEPRSIGGPFKPRTAGVGLILLFKKNK